MCGYQNEYHNIYNMNGRLYGVCGHSLIKHVKYSATASWTGSTPSVQWYLSDLV
jgi:hypothetical protein